MESLQKLFLPQPASADLGPQLTDIASYPTEQLWAVVYRRLPWPRAQRLHTLSRKTKQESFTEEEQDELADLFRRNDQVMLLRSEALVLLKQRGYVVEAYLAHNA